LLTGTDQLVVAAHVRDCPLCKHDVEVCRPPEPRPRSVIARFIPPALASGLRSAESQTNVRQYMAADLVIELTVAPPMGDYWRITGQILRAGAGLAERTITLRAGRRHYQRISDPQGFFTFAEVPAGRYTLSVVEGSVQVQIRDLALGPDNL